MNNAQLKLLACHMPAYEPECNPVASDAGEMVNISTTTQAILTKYHAVIEMLCQSGYWTENRAHLKNHFRVCGGRYQLSASCTYMGGGRLKMFTVRLLLDLETLTPVSLMLAFRTPTLLSCGEPYDVTISIDTLMNEDIITVTDMVSTLTIGILEKYKASMVDGLAASDDKVNERFFEVEKREYKLAQLERAVTKKIGATATNAKVIGFGIDNLYPTLFASYETDAGTGVYESIITRYYERDEA